MRHGVRRPTTEVRPARIASRTASGVCSSASTSVVGRRTPWRISVKQFGGGVKRRIVRALLYPF
jgi:hypothetical protein